MSLNGFQRMGFLVQASGTRLLDSVQKLGTCTVQHLPVRPALCLLCFSKGRRRKGFGCQVPFEAC